MTGTCVVCKTEFDNAPISYQGTSFVPSICKACSKQGWRQRRDGGVYQKKDQASEFFSSSKKAAAPAPIGNQAPDHSERNLAGGPGPNPGKAGGAANGEVAVAIDDLQGAFLKLRALLIARGLLQ